MRRSCPEIQFKKHGNTKHYVVLSWVIGILVPSARGDGQTDRQSHKRRTSKLIDWKAKAWARAWARAKAKQRQDQKKRPKKSKRKSKSKRRKEKIVRYIKCLDKKTCWVIGSVSLSQWVSYSFSQWVLHKKTYIRLNNAELNSLT